MILHPTEDSWGTVVKGSGVPAVLAASFLPDALRAALRHVGPGNRGGLIMFVCPYEGTQSSHREIAEQ